MSDSLVTLAAAFIDILSSLKHNKRNGTTL